MSRQHTALRGAIVALIDNARIENRTVFADREALIMLRQFPDAGVSNDEIVQLILSACSDSAGASVTFGE